MNTKNIISNYKSVLTILLFTFLISCNQDNEFDRNLDQEFSDEFEVFDANGELSIIIRVSADDESIVNYYSAENFELVINPSQEEMNDDILDDEEEDDGTMYSEDNSISFTLGVVEERFKDVEVFQYDIVKTQPIEFEDLRASWTKEHYYNSSREGFKIKRTSWNRRVYVSTKYCNSSCGTGDQDIENGWEPANYNDYKLSNNEEITDEVCGSQYIGAVVRAKKHSGKYTHSFYVVSSCD